MDEGTHPKEPTDTTEIYDPKLEIWSLQGKIPLPLWESIVRTLDNKVFFFGRYIFVNISASSLYGCLIIGGLDKNTERVDTILEFDVHALTWSEVGHMPQETAGHAVSVVNFTDFAVWCH